MSDLGDFENYDPDDGPGGGDAGAGADAGGSADAGGDGTATGADAGDAFEEMSASPVGTDRGIGTLSASEGLVISEEADDTCLRAYVTVENR